LEHQRWIRRRGRLRGRGEVRKGATLTSVVAGIVRERPQVPAGSGDKSGQPGGTIQREKRGKPEREARAFIGADEAAELLRE
jgi:hypothetical protein